MSWVTLFYLSDNKLHDMRCLLPQNLTWMIVNPQKSYPCKRFGQKVKEAEAKWYNHQIWKYLRYKTYGRLHYISVANLVLRKTIHNQTP